LAGEVCAFPWDEDAGEAATAAPPFAVEAATLFPPPPPVLAPVSAGVMPETATEVSCLARRLRISILWWWACSRTPSCWEDAHAGDVAAAASVRMSVQRRAVLDGVAERVRGCMVVRNVVV